MTTRTGIGIDTHAFAEGRRLVLGGVELAGETGLAGHSDADVLCHALMDALLGAIADGDIGLHFPDNGPEWKDACSLDMLGAVRERVAARGCSVTHVDATVLAERPRLAPHVPEMREKVAAVLDVPLRGVSIKATTCEGLGAIGRCEGISAIAVATVECPD